MVVLWRDGRAALEVQMASQAATMQTQARDRVSLHSKHEQHVHTLLGHGR